MTIGKCASCKQTPTKFRYEATTIADSMGRNGYKGVKIICPHCMTIQSITFDPLALQTDLINKLKGK